MEQSDSLTTPNWQPVGPAVQWPNFSTDLIVTANPGEQQHFYRVTASP